MTNASLSRPFTYTLPPFSSCSSPAGGALIVLQFQQGMQQGLEHERPASSNTGSSLPSPSS